MISCVLVTDGGKLVDGLNIDLLLLNSALDNSVETSKMQLITLDRRSGTEVPLRLFYVLSDSARAIRSIGDVREVVRQRWNRRYNKWQHSKRGGLEHGDEPIGKWKRRLGLCVD
jgi:hypothetical protein